MLFRIIMILCVFMVFITIYATLHSAYKPKKNMFMAVTLPSEVLEGEFVKNIQNEFKSLCNKIYLIMILTAIPVVFPFWIFENTTIYIIYIVVWSLFFSYYGATVPFKKMNRKVKAEKNKNQWFIGEKKVVYCDTKTTLLKNSMPISDKYFLMPLLINVFVLVICFKNFSSENITFLIIAILNLALIMLLFYTTKDSNKSKLKTYSTDSEVNFILNKAEKRMFSIYFLINAIFESVTLLVIYLVLLDYIDIKFFDVILISVIILSCTISMGFIYIKRKVSSLEEELTEKKNYEEIIVDDDDYWIDGIYYYNPNDTSKTVSRRFGYGMTYNLATKQGNFIGKKLDKIVLIATFILIAVLIIPSEFTSSKITLSSTEPNISISAFPYSYELNYKDIESITITDEPISFRLRTNGIGTDEKLIGNFKSDKYDKCRVYLYPKDNSEYIVAKLKNSKFDYLIYNTKDKTYTQKTYTKILNNIK
ncbi:MAG: hypothetical protein ACI4PU_05480 [Intestinibacter sp.]